MIAVDRSTASTSISSEHVATRIRDDLERVYPEIDFRVTEDPNEVQVTYVDGIPEREVLSVIGKYEFGCCDDMSAPKVMNLWVHRSVTPESRIAAGRLVCNKLQVSESYADVMHSDLYVVDAGKTMGKLVDMQLGNMWL